MLRVLVLALLALPLTPLAAAEDVCVASACAYSFDFGSGSRTGLRASAPDGTTVDAALSMGQGFWGDYTIVGVDFAAPAAGNEGYATIATRDTLPVDGRPDAACVCFAAWDDGGYTAVGGAGVEDADFDGTSDPEAAYAFILVRRDGSLHGAFAGFGDSDGDGRRELDNPVLLVGP